MEFEFNDGGRASAGYKGDAGDCVVRSIAIASGRSYQEVYDALNAASVGERKGKRKRGISNARTGVYSTTARKYIASIGGVWVPTMSIGSGCTVHLKASELPAGRLVVSVSKHYTAVVDGVIHDTHDPSRNETRCVYGYFKFADAKKPTCHYDAGSPCCELHDAAPNLLTALRAILTLTARHGGTENDAEAISAIEQLAAVAVREVGGR